MSKQDPNTQAISEILTQIGEKMHVTLNECSENDIVLEFNQDKFLAAYDSYIKPIIDVSLNNQPESSLIKRSVGMVGESVGFTVESCEFLISFIPYVGKPLYNGMKRGHFKSNVMHNRLCSKFSSSANEVKTNVADAISKVSESIEPSGNDAPAPAVP